MLQDKFNAGISGMAYTDIGQELRKRSIPYTGKVKTLMQDAEQAGIVYSWQDSQQRRVNLTMKGMEYHVGVPYQFRALVDLLKDDNGSCLLSSLSRLQPKAIPYGKGKVREHVDDVIEEGLIRLRGAVVELLPGVN